MDNQEKSNGWDELLEDLGAKPDPSAFERHQPKSHDLPPSMQAHEHGDLPTLPQRGPSDWNALAETLGLEVEAEAETESPKPVAKSESVIANTTRKKTEAASKPDKKESDEPFDDELGLVDETDTDLADDEAVADDDDDFDDDEWQDDDSTTESYEVDELPPLPSQTDLAMSEPVWEEGSEQQSDESDSFSSSRGITGEAARSAFDALFSDGASSWGSAFLEPAKRDETLPKPTEPFEDEFMKSLNKEDDANEDDEESPRRKRPRRRRRGGRGRKSGAEATGEDATREEATDGELAEEVSTDDTKKPRRRRRRGRVSAEASEAAEDSWQEAEDDDDSGTSTPRGRQRHRNLPTWSEAIGMIVDANLEQRAKAPSNPQSSRGRGRRGGRRRGKSDGK